MITTLTKRSFQGLVVASVCLLSLACGSDDDDAPSCGTEAAPNVMPLRDVSPGRGASVTNAGIVHRFTIVGIETVFQSKFQLSRSHTAGEATPLQIQITPRVMGSDVTYEFSPMTWSVAPGRVVMEDTPLTLYKASNGCFYEFPKPLFEYQIVP